MIGGQVSDLEGEGKPPTAALLETIHRSKTGALLRASLRMGAIYAGRRSLDSIDALSCYGEHVGLAFQIVDDLLDVEAIFRGAGQNSRERCAAEQDHVSGRLWSGAFAPDGGAGTAAPPIMLCSPLDGRGERLRELADLIVHRKT